MDNEFRVFGGHQGALVVRSGKIDKIGSVSECLESTKNDEKVYMEDLQGAWILPGFINTHVHTAQQLARGLGDDVNLINWLHNRIWPYESNLTKEDSYISAMLCGLEQIRSGTTCFAEAAGQHVHSIAKAVEELGIRAVLSRSSMDSGIGLPRNWLESTEDVLSTQVSLFNELHNSCDGRVRIWFNIRTIFNATDELLKKTKQFADERKVGIHMHVAEVKEEVEYCLKTRGNSTVKHLQFLDFLDKNLLAIHSVWLDKDELQMFADKSVNVSHCPAAAMRYLGFAKVPEMIDMGINVSIGTDGAPSNNRMTIVDEMWLTALIHKGRLCQPDLMQSQTILKMVTRNAAKAVMWDDEIGSLEVSKKADLVVINPNTPNMLPMNDPISNLVNAIQQHNIDSVMVNGKWIMRHRKILTVDEEKILHMAKISASEIIQRANICLPDRFPFVTK